MTQAKGIRMAAICLLMLGGAACTADGELDDQAAQAQAASACSKLTVVDVSASGSDENVPANAIDGRLETRWSGEGVGSWILADLGSTNAICKIALAWHRGDVRTSDYSISVSTDGARFTEIFFGRTSGTTLNPQSLAFANVSARYVKVIVRGNTENEWASITELSIFGGQMDMARPEVAILSPTTGTTLKVGQVTVRGSTSGTGVVWAGVKIDNGRYVDATPRAPGDYSAWSATLSLPVTGDYRLTARAENSAGVLNWADVTVHMVATAPTPGPAPTPEPTPNPGPTPTPEAADCEKLSTPLRTFTVTSLGALQSQINEAQPGDRIIVQNGVYTASAPIVVSRKGTAAAPITIMAATINGAEIKGTAGFKLVSASYVNVCGFKLTHDAYAGGQERVGLLLDGCDHVRISRNLFMLTNGSRFADWLLITGAGSGYNVVDHNKFQNKSNEGVFVYIQGTRDQSYISHDDVIERNYFVGHSFGGENGGESFRAGDSPWQRLSPRAKVQYNLFEQCNGDSEVISNKTADNLYLGNTFRNNRGGLMLRHSHRARVEGNFFLNNYRYPAIEVYGNGHAIVNNYIEGHDAWAALYLGDGDVDDDLAPAGSSAYDRPSSVVVAFNTLVNGPNGNLVVGANMRSFRPKDCVIANNLLQSNGDAMIWMPNAVQGFTWEGNIAWGSADMGGVSAGFTRVDPQLRQSNGLYRPMSSSPAI
ncbi:MAG: chondroitinase-B domain-containing protein, partial [Thermomicrobiales bacterium]